ncbi:MAG: hypothetical protein IIA54_05260 [Chloroflexi bacterium]|nr:hypothetical protein [Chloroflexota bacterium]
MSVLGMNSAVVSATATAIKTSPGGGDGLMPWSVLQETRDDASPGESLVLKYDASELIAEIPKLAPDGEWVRCQAYLLTDGRGRRIDEADTRMVVDATDRRHPAIRTPGSCIRCHVEGINTLPENYTRAAIFDGQEITLKKLRDADDAERIYLGLLKKDQRRHQEDFADFVKAACGAAPVQAIVNYTAALAYYDRPVSLQQGAAELAATAEDLSAAIAYASELLGPNQNVARLTALPHGRAAPRKVWEQAVYRQAFESLVLWRARTP